MLLCGNIFFLLLSSYYGDNNFILFCFFILLLMVFCCRMRYIRRRTCTWELEALRQETRLLCELSEASFINKSYQNCGKPSLLPPAEPACIVWPCTATSPCFRWHETYLPAAPHRQPAAPPAMTKLLRRRMKRETETKRREWPCPCRMISACFLIQVE